MKLQSPDYFYLAGSSKAWRTHLFSIQTQFHINAEEENKEGSLKKAKIWPFNMFFFKSIVKTKMSQKVLLWNRQDLKVLVEKSLILIRLLCIYESVAFLSVLPELSSSHIYYSNLSNFLK